MNLLRFPAALYLRLFGATGLGYIVARIGTEATYLTLAIACSSFGASLVGWMMMRPLMRDAKKAIAGSGQLNSKPEEINDIDA